MKDAITCTFWQFMHRLNEWLPTTLINRRKSEIFSLYCLGHGEEVVANHIEQIEADHAGTEPE